MSRQIVFTENAPAPIGPYSQAILVNDTIYLSGQIAINPNSGEMINANITDETKHVLNNLQAVLQAGGFEFNHVVKASVFLSNMDYFGEMNEAYNSVFSDIKPARETVEVARLPKDVNVEISLIAVK